MTEGGRCALKCCVCAIVPRDLTNYTHQDGESLSTYVYITF